MGEMLADNELVEELKKNPSVAVAEIMDLYGGAVKKICITYLNGYSNEDIEEAVADCFVALWRSIDHFDQTRNVSLKSYLYGIARMQALNKKRALAKRDERYHVTEDEEIMNQIPDNNETEQIIDDKLRTEMVRDMINHMTPPDDAIFMLRYYSQMTEREIAMKLQMTVKAIENRLARGRKMLRRQLMENGVGI